MHGVYFFILERQIFKGITDPEFISKFGGSSVFHTGWGNGYVMLPPEHPWYGLHYDSIYVEAPGGLTYSDICGEKKLEDWFGDNEFEVCDELNSVMNYDFSNYWIIGFDTGHAGMNLQNFGKVQVFAEAHHVYEQCISDEVEGSVAWKKKWERRNRQEKIKYISATDEGE
jgi:hypothetical protein